LACSPVFNFHFYVNARQRSILPQHRRDIPASDPKETLISGNLMTHISEQELIGNAQRGDIAALSLIYEKYSRRVFNLCLRMIRDRADAEDLTQDVFVQLFRKIHTFRGQSAFSTWLHRLAVNMVLMEIRSRKSHRYCLVPIEPKSDDDDDAGGEQFGREDDRLRSSIDRLMLQDALEELPPGYRLVFLLHDVHGYEHQEIAEILSCSVGNCKSQLHKARLKLRKLMEAKETEEVRELRAA
jgi:RNA polymerase sigma-70 factor (ECF subfamily)